MTDKEWIDGKVKSSIGEPSAEVVNITPSLAAALLKNDNGAESHYNEIIAVSRDGFLCSGQEKLKSCVRMNVTYQAVILFGVSAGPL